MGWTLRRAQGRITAVTGRRSTSNLNSADFGVTCIPGIEEEETDCSVAGLLERPGNRISLDFCKDDEAQDSRHLKSHCS